jgi:anti-sigma regulatory factor (Ser/Thr protein kinase)
METVIASATFAPDTSTLVLLDDESQIGAARRAANMLGLAQGLGVDALGRLAIVVTEAATNVIRHGMHGVLVLRALHASDGPAVEILALDKGPGIPDVARAMADGYSTIGTAGDGLGGMRRLADVFDLHSQRGLGTALLARVFDGKRAQEPRARAATLDDRCGVVCLPLAGQTECGDAWRIAADADRIAVLLVDGLGHGSGAAGVSGSVLQIFSAVANVPPPSALSRFDAALRGTRGAALSFAVLDESAQQLQFSGVGNVDGRVLVAGPEKSGSHLVPQNGIVGHTMPTLRAVSVPFPDGARLVMHSDGISARWRPETYAGLEALHPALVAGLIYRDFARTNDDATVLVLAARPGGSP